MMEQLKEQELNLRNNIKKFNKKGEQLEKLYSKIRILPKLKGHSKDTFFNKFFESRKKFQTKRSSRLVSD